MTAINYDLYLDGDEWPSESSTEWSTAAEEYVPELRPVIDMPPQYAASALAKLVRWARDGGGPTEQGEYEEEWRVRNSRLGQLLSARACSINDFADLIAARNGRDSMGNHSVARALCIAILNTADMDPVAAARLASDVAVDLNNSGYLMYSEA